MPIGGDLSGIECPECSSELTFSEYPSLNRHGDSDLGLECESDTCKYEEEPDIYNQRLEPEWGSSEEEKSNDSKSKARQSKLA